MLSRLLSRIGRPAHDVPSTDGRLVYAVGDVHGRQDLLAKLLAAIRADARKTAPRERPILVFLGDYVDRGPASAQVVETVRALAGTEEFETRTLMGNHEQTLLQFLEDPEVGPGWAEFGGGETLAAYGVAPPSGRAEPEAWIAARAAFAAAVPPAHIAFLKGLEYRAEVGDYLFVHAGVRPDMPLDRQDVADLLWIRGEFLENERRLEKVVVHGHTPETEPFLGRARIGVDTGAYATGVLTAARLHGTEQSVLQARPGG